MIFRYTFILFTFLVSSLQELMIEKVRKNITVFCLTEVLAILTRVEVAYCVTQQKIKRPGTKYCFSIGKDLIHIKQKLLSKYKIT
jgi:hypothetical protein